MTTPALPTTLDEPTNRRIEARLDAQLDSTPMPEQLAHERIAQLAYGIYLARGAQDGHDMEDWLEAERRFVNESLAP